MHKNSQLYIRREPNGSTVDTFYNLQVQVHVKSKC